MSQNNIFIIGTGFIGSNLAKKLRASLGINPKVLTRDRINYFCEETLTAFFANSFGRYNNIVINCAGFTGRPNIDQCESEKELTWKCNALLPKIIETATAKAGGVFCQVSSGCIYTGYNKAFTEEDTPNFGLFNTESSFYSKSKHAAELTLNKKSYIFRIRMPFTYLDVNNQRNYLSKLKNYDNIIDNINSRTCVEDFCNFVSHFCLYPDFLPPGTYNVVNPNPLSVSEIISILPEKYKNPNWKFIPLSELKTTAGRSNCVLSAKRLESFWALPEEKSSWGKIE